MTIHLSLPKELQKRMETLACKIADELERVYGTNFLWKWEGYNIILYHPYFGSSISSRLYGLYICTENKRGSWESKPNGRVYVKFGHKSNDSLLVWKQNKDDPDFMVRYCEIALLFNDYTEEAIEKDGKQSEAINNRFRFELELEELGFDGWQGQDGGVYWVVTGQGVKVSMEIRTVVTPDKLRETIDKLNKLHSEMYGGE